MKPQRALGIAAIAAAFLTAFVGTATASVVTSPAGTTYTGETHWESVGKLVLHSENAPTAFTPECKVTMQINHNSHGSGVTAGGNVTHITWFNCTNGATVVVSKGGTLEAHALGGGNGTMTSSGNEMTIHVPVLNIKCIYTTNNTDIGTLTGSNTTGGTATLDINSATLPRTGGSAFCGTGAFSTGFLKISKPDYVDVS